MSLTKTILLPGHYYHIYNHGNADDNLFKNENNYDYFLKRYAFFVSPVADTLAYCLLPNHFHFVIQLKDKNTIINLYKQKNCAESSYTDDELYNFITQQFSNFFNSYSKAFNKLYTRNGKLFRLPFKRKSLENHSYLMNAIHYVHTNPVHHEFTKDMHSWKYSSVHAYESNKRSAIKKDAMLNLFGGIEGFVHYHLQPVDINYKIDMDF